MGVGRNLAYKKDFFFSHGGFSGMLEQRAGDDDLLVNKLATAANTAVVVSRESIVWSVPKRSFEEWFVQKRRHLSVAPSYRTATKFRLTFEPVTRALWYAAVTTVAVLCAMGTLHLSVGLATALLFAVRLMMQITVISRTAHLLGTREFGLSVLFFDIFMPLMQISMLMRKNNNTW